MSEWNKEADQFDSERVYRVVASKCQINDLVRALATNRNAEVSREQYENQRI